MTPNPPFFSKEKEELFQKRYEEKYDIPDPEYVAWLRLNHPDAEVSPSEASSLSSGKQGSIDTAKVLAEVLVLPEPKAPKKRQKEPACAKCVTDDSVLEELKAKEKEKAAREEAKKAKALEREQKKKEREERKENAKANTWKKRRAHEKETVDILSILNPSDESGDSETGVALKNKQKKEESKEQRKDREGTNTQKNRRAHENKTVVELLSKRNLSDEESGGFETDESDAVCPKCGVLYSTDRKNKWVGCDRCGAWYHVKCTHLKEKRKLPEDFFFCENCM